MEGRFFFCCFLFFNYNLLFLKPSWKWIVTKWHAQYSLVPEWHIFQHQRYSIVLGDVFLFFFASRKHFSNNSLCLIVAEYQPNAAAHAEMWQMCLTQKDNNIHSPWERNTERERHTHTHTKEEHTQWCCKSSLSSTKHCQCCRLQYTVDRIH